MFQLQPDVDEARVVLPEGLHAPGFDVVVSRFYVSSRFHCKSIMFCELDLLNCDEMDEHLIVLWILWMMNYV